MNASLGLTLSGESETEERKQSWQDKECLEALAALANTRGGTLWVGVKDNGEPVGPNGWPDAADGGRMEAITSKIVAKLGLHPLSVTVETVQDAPVLAIRMPSAPAPVLLNGHFWRRVGNSSREVPADELTRFLLERTGMQWDALPCAVGMGALDSRTLADFKTLAQNRLPALRRSDDAATILDNLQLRDDEGRLRRAAVLLFGQTQAVQGLSSTAFVQIGRFKGDGAMILDDRQIVGNLFVQLDGVLAALRTYLQVRYEFPAEAGDRTGAAALQRVEIWEYPLTALREAVANALLHRDYTDTSRVLIRVYDDHILISSPGLLPEGVTLADLSRDPHRSKLRNPLLAQTFFFAELIERWGTGTTRMAELCAAQGLPAPEFEQVSGEVWVTFRKDPYTDTRLQQMGLSHRQIQAVRFVQQNGSISNAEYRGRLSVSARTALSDLSDLVAREIFVPSGGRGPTAHYRMKNAQITQSSRSNRATEKANPAADSAEEPAS